MNRQRTHRTACRGTTLVEALMALSTLAVALSATLPGWSDVRVRRQLEGSAAQLQSDLALARSLAVSQGESIRLSVAQTPAGACYLIHTGAAGDCSCTAQGHALCTAGAQSFRTVGFDAQQAVQLQSNSRSMVFSAARGTITPTATLALRGQDGRGLNLVVNIMGRVRTCSPDTRMPAHPLC